MKTGQYLLPTAMQVSPNEPVNQVLNLMQELEYEALPVVDGDFFQGLLLRSELENVMDEHLLLSESGVRLQHWYLFEDQHILDAIALFVNHNIALIPVVTPEFQYVGLIDRANLLSAIHALLDTERSGSILILEMGLRDNALSHIAHIVESANAQVLSSFTRVLPEDKLEITLKINTQSLSEVVAALLRYDYHIKSTYSIEHDKEDIHARFEHLMNYINM